jgi:hypothetical protein
VCRTNACRGMPTLPSSAFRLQIYFVHACERQAQLFLHNRVSIKWFAERHLEHVQWWFTGDFAARVSPYLRLRPHIKLCHPFRPPSSRLPAANHKSCSVLVGQRSWGPAKAKWGLSAHLGPARVASLFCPPLVTYCIQATVAANDGYEDDHSSPDDPNSEETLHVFAPDPEV